MLLFWTDLLTRIIFLKNNLTHEIIYFLNGNETRRVNLNTIHANFILGQGEMEQSDLHK